MKINKISIIIPCFNEKETILTLVDKVNNFNKIDKEIIIVDDFSFDGTREILQKEITKKYNNINLILHSKNKGKGAAIRTALESVKLSDAFLGNCGAVLPQYFTSAMLLGACQRVVNLSIVSGAFFATLRCSIACKYTTYSFLVLPFATVK